MLTLGYPLAVLTPNVPEFKRLADHTKASSAEGVSKSLNVALLQKGAEDKVGRESSLNSPTSVRPSAPPCLIPPVVGGEVAVGSEPGSPRRCGGQGDLLSGTLGTFLGWANLQAKQTNASTISNRLILGAALGASMLVRRSARLAFNVHFR